MSNEEILKEIKDNDVKIAEGVGRLYEQNIKIIRKIALKYANYAELDDLMQEAYLGLYTAAMHYDCSAGVKFITYAYQWICQAITRYIENNGSTIRIPSHRQNLLLKYRRLLERYEKEYNREPATTEISRELQMFPDQVEKLQKDYACMATRSLDALVAGGDNEKITVADTIAGDTDVENMVLNDIVGKQFKEEFWELVGSKLDENENLVITERFKNNRTRAELPDILPQMDEEPLTVNKCRSIEDRALRKLRHSNLASTLNKRYEMAISKAYKGSVWSDNIFYSPTERAAFKDLGIRF